MSTSLKLYSTYGGKAVNSTFSSINPNATAAQMKAAAQALNSLTLNTYSKSEKIETTDLDTAAQKLTPLIKIADSEETPLTRTRALDGYIGALEVVGDGEISIIPDDTTTWLVTLRYGQTSHQWRILVGCFTSADAQAAATAPYDIVLRTAETDDYEAGEFRITIANE